MADDSRKLFYSIGEVADIFHVNESTLRFWEKEFPTVIKPKKNAKGTRTYTKDDIENIRLVHFLVKEKGMTLAGARKKLREEKKGMTAQRELADRLKKIKSELLKLQSELGKPAQEAPEFPEPEIISNRMVFAEPGTEMIPIEVVLHEMPIPELLPEELPELILEELPVPEVEHLQVSDFEASPFDFDTTYSTEEKLMEESLEESEAQEETILEESEVSEEPEFLDEPVTQDESEVQDEPELPEDAPVIPQPQPEPDPEPEPEQNLFYEQPEPVEPPKPAPSNDGWSGTLF